MSKNDLYIIHDALCFVCKPDNIDKFDKFLRRNLRGNPDAYNEFRSGKRSNDGHELIGRVFTLIKDMEAE